MCERSNLYLNIYNIVILSILLFSSGYHVGVNSIQKQAVENGCANYDPLTKKFEWKNVNDNN